MRFYCFPTNHSERVTNRGASALVSLTNLKVLNLSHTRVNVTAQIRLPKSLESLALAGCLGIDDAKCVSALQTSLPALKCLRLDPLSDEDGMMFDTDEEDGASSALCVLQVQAFDRTIDAAMNPRAFAGVHDDDISSEISNMDDGHEDDIEESDSFYSNLD
jgi:hypothetical protein